MQARTQEHDLPGKNFRQGTTFSSMLTTSMQPVSAATCSGVTAPCAFASTAAPASSSIRASGTFPGAAWPLVTIYSLLHVPASPRVLRKDRLS